MHTTHFPLSRFQMVVTVLLAIASFTSAQASIKQNVPMYPHWKFGGCWSDTDPTVRALTTEVTVPGGLSNASVENCIGECNSLNFKIAGMKGNACWCDNKIASDSNSAQTDQTKCNTPCTGDSTEWCGGAKAFLRYNNPPQK
ncbi:hypothetical protein EI94DRAFT_435289 [Lactarius quietus]|nr:hypothetical protein EI94DRAFT_435289 [Lactarius quietus]